MGGPAQKIRLSLAEIGLMNRTEGIPNVSCGILFEMEKHGSISTKGKNKQRISTLRGTLQKKFGLSSNPFHIERGRYVPNFQLIDDRDAADRRAEAKAVHMSFNDEWQSEVEMSDGVTRPERIEY